MDKNGINETLFDFIYSEALDDATRRTDAARVKQRIAKCAKIKAAVWDYAAIIINGEALGCKDKEREKNFIDCVSKIEKIISDEGIEYFRFGNAQKLITMTMKYLYIRYCDTDKERFFDCCYAPMDRIMIARVRKDCRRNGIKCEVEAECAWSKIEFEKIETEPKYDSVNFWRYQDAIGQLIKKEHNKYQSRLKYEYMTYNEYKK